MKKQVGLIGVICAMALLSVAGCRPGRHTPESFVQEGNELFFKGDFRQAELAYRQAVEADASVAAAWTGLAETRLKLGDPKGAAEAYARLLEIEPANSHARLSLARFDLLNNRLENAEAGVSAVLGAEPDNIDALFLFAELCERGGRLKQAEQVYDRILALEAQNIKALLRLGVIYARTGDLEKAQSRLEQAVAVDPSAVEPRLVLFNFHVGKKDYPAAEAELLSTIETNPDNPELRILLGNFYFSRRLLDQAEAAFLKAMETGKTYMPAYLAAGTFYRVSGKKDKALEMYRAALKINPHSLRTRQALAGFYLENKQNEDAGREVEIMLHENAAYFPARMLKVRLLVAEARYDQALALCDAYLKENPASSDLYYAKGQAHWGKNDLAAAEKALAQAVSLSPGNISARLLLADVYLKRGETEKAQTVNRDLLAFLRDHLKLEVVATDAVLPEKSRTKGVDSFSSLSDLAAAHPFGESRVERLSGLMEKYDQTIKGFETALQKDPLQEDVFENIILLHVAKQEYDRAIERCNRRINVIKQMPDISPEQRQSHLASVYNLTGGLYLVKQDREKAKESFRQAINADPRFLRPYFAMARLHILDKDLDAAISQYKAILEKDSSQPGPHILLGVLYKMKGDSVSSEHHYRTALELNPKLAQAANNLAYLLSENPDRLDESLSFALQARALQGDDPYIRDTLGWIYYRMGRYEDALKEFQETVKILPENATVNYHLGMSYYKTGQPGQARVFLDKALSLNETFYGVDQARVILEELMASDRTPAGRTI
ncbi:MAG: tetratricopeptide repeat protein [Thermodesulfobacteriota bacterium]